MDGMTIVIPSAGETQVLSWLLRSIQAQRCEFPIEVILIGNGMSAPAKWQKFQELIPNDLKLDLRVEKIEWSGVNRSRNLGLSLAKFKIVFFVDDDCELDDELLLQKHYRLHRRSSNAFAIGGLYDISPQAGFFTRLYQTIQMNWLYRGLIATGPACEYLIGGHFSVKRNIARQNEIFFDESIIYGGSELSFFKKARLHQLELQLHEFSVRHHTRETFFSLHRKIVKQGQGQAKVPGRDRPIQNEVRRSNSFFISYFSMLFWFGFFRGRKNILGFFVFVFETTKNNLLFRKYRILDSINSMVESKKKRGDRV